MNLDPGMLAQGLRHMFSGGQPPGGGMTGEGMMPNPGPSSIPPSTMGPAPQNFAQRMGQNVLAMKGMGGFAPGGMMPPQQPPQAGMMPPPQGGMPGPGQMQGPPPGGMNPQMLAMMLRGRQ